MKKLTLGVGRRDEGKRLDRLLESKAGLSRDEARAAVLRGSAWIGGQKVRDPARVVHEGEQVVLVAATPGAPPAPPPGPANVPLAPGRILHEDEELIAVDKPAGLAAHPSPKGGHRDLLSLVSAHLGREAGLVHRLDLETSGVTVFGKTPAATAALAKAFEEGAARKRYLAVAVGPLPDEGRIDLPISPDPRRWGRFRAVAGGKLSARTSFRVLARKEALCAVELRPETGRTHQLRVHLKALGAPILGDDLYGGPGEAKTTEGTIPAGRVMLHAWRLAIPHPRTGESLELCAPVPGDIGAFLVAVGAGLERA